MTKYLFAVIAVLIAGLFITVHRIESLNGKYETAIANLKNYSLELSNAEKKNTAYKLTIDQLSYFKDSVLVELDETRKELKIKDKNLKALQAVNSSFSKLDTVIFRDTLFLDPTLSIDTTLSDEWYSLTLGLKYPSTITASPSFISKKHIIVSTKKETVNPPKKWWIQRIFQKKHKVLRVNVVEKNPYVNDESSKYVEIIK